MSLKTWNYEVDVLMATYNGEKFLRPQLDSIATQQGVKINLIVGDDGSTDGSLRIISEYKYCFNSLTIYESSRLGPSNNFLKLLRKSSSSFVAFSDQDDIWLEEHLLDSINRISESNSPKLTFCRTKLIDETGNLISTKPWPSSIKFPKTLFLTENLARGCTIVMNGKARDLINAHNSGEAIMHDWWCLITVAGVGQIAPSNHVEVLYRLHDNNHIGLNRSWIIKVAKLIMARRRPVSAILSQIKSLKDLYGQDLCIEYQSHILNLLEIAESSSATFRYLKVRKLPKLRRKSWENFVVKFIFLLRIPELRGRELNEK